MTELAVFEVMGAKSPSATIRNRGAVIGQDGTGWSEWVPRRRGTVPHGCDFADRIAVDLAHEDVPNQHHDEREDRHRDDQAGEPEQLSDEQHAGDGDHRRQVDLPLHDDRRHEVGLDEVDAHAERATARALVKPNTPRAKSAGNRVENRMPKNGTMAATPAKTPNARKYGTPRAHRSERGEGSQQHHRDDLADHPGADRELEIVQDRPGQRPAPRRNQGHDAVDVDRGMSGEKDRHHEHAHALDEHLDAALEVRHGGAPQKPEDLVQRGGEQPRRPSAPGVALRRSTGMLRDQAVDVRVEAGEVIAAGW